MREILFRGKRADNGEWVEGHYFSCWDKNYICWGTINENIKNIEVIPETVGQFTGKFDKNGKKIFEGVRSLASAVVTLAVEDSKALFLKRKRLHNKIRMATDIEEKRQLRARIKYVEKQLESEKEFFCSEWCETLLYVLGFSLTGEEIFKKIEANAHVK